MHFNRLWDAGRNGDSIEEGSEPRPELPPEQLRAISQFFGTIPPEILTRLRRLRNGQFQLYRLMAWCGEPAMALVDSNPALATALVLSHELGAQPRPLQTARRLLAGKPTDMLGWLRFPATECARKIFAKLGSEDSQFVFVLRPLMKAPRVVKLLSALPRLNEPVLKCVFELPDAMTAPFLLEILSKDDEEAGRIVNLVEAVKDLLGQFDRTAPRLRSEDQLVKLYQDLDLLPEQRYCDEQLAQWRNTVPGTFPPAPLLPPRDSGIEPITTLLELCAESVTQRNRCIDCTERILKGEFFVYRVTRPSRATLVLARKDELWMPDQLVWAGHRIVSRPEELEPYENIKVDVPTCKWVVDVLSDC